MELEIENAVVWSEAIFGRCDLGDKRLTGRLVKIGSQLSKSQGASLAKSCEGKSASIEGSYRFIRNSRVSAKQIAEGGYPATALLAQRIPVLLAIEDSTSLSYKHEVSERLGHTSNSLNTKTQGYLVHSTMLMDAQKEKTIGLIAQERWCRDKSSYGKNHHRNKIQYKDKESYKWVKNTHFMENCLGEK
ncbi:transposase DNA-binding-containing protein, partial [Legionella gratiana]